MPGARPSGSIGSAVAQVPPSGQASLALGPGQLGRAGPADVMMFDAGACIRTLDLFAAFLRDEAIKLDWLRDFLCNPAMDTLLDTLTNPPADEEEPEQLYTKSQLTTLGSEVMDEY